MDKFEVGDKVKITKDRAYAAEVVAGDIGTVIHAGRGTNPAYTVKLSRTGLTWSFHEDVMEAVTIQSVSVRALRAALEILGVDNADRIVSAARVIESL